MNKSEIDKLIKERTDIDDNNPELSDFWDKLAEALSKDEAFTIAYFENADEDAMSWLSEVFEDIAYKLQSTDYIACLKRMDAKFPQLELASTVVIAEDMME